MFFLFKSRASLIETGNLGNVILPLEDHTLQLRLVAGLVAYVSMLQHGSVKVQLRDGKGHLGPQRLTKLMEKFVHHFGCSKNHTGFPGFMFMSLDVAAVPLTDVLACGDLVRLSDHVSLLRTVTFLDAPNGEALELDVSRQIWEEIPRCL